MPDNVILEEYAEILDLMLIICNNMGKVFEISEYNLIIDGSGVGDMVA
jgi:hypothetical protein